MMRVLVLGSGGSSGVPLIGGANGQGEWGACDSAEPRNCRTRASILISGEGGRLLVDTSPDMRAQLLGAGEARVDAIFYTHAHADHILGLDDVRALNRAVGRPLEAFASPATLTELGRRFEYAFRPWQKPGFYRPVLLARPVTPGAEVRIGGWQVQTYDQDHGYTRSVGLRIGNFAYSTDVVALDDASLERLTGLDTWLVGCFQREEHRTHAWLGRVLEWVARVRPRRTVLTHMGPDMDWGWLVGHLPSGIEPAHDGLVLEIPS